MADKPFIDENHLYRKYYQAQPNVFVSKRHKLKNIEIIFYKNAILSWCINCLSHNSQEHSTAHCKTGNTASLYKMICLKF